MGKSIWKKELPYANPWYFILGVWMEYGNPGNP